MTIPVRPRFAVPSDATFNLCPWPLTMSTDRSPRPVGASLPIDERDLVYDLRKRAAELHTRAARIEAKAWEINRAIALRKARVR